MRLNDLIATVLLVPLLLGFYTKYKYLDDIGFPVKEDVGDGSYLYRPVNTTFNESFVERDKAVIISYMNSFAAQHSLPIDFCHDKTVDFYIVDFRVLNDKKRYPSTTNRVPEIWGLYDSYSPDPARAAIILTDNSNDRIDSVIMAHEYAHYIYDIYCWSDDWPGDTETFAVAFQKYYGLKRFGRMYE